MMERHAGLFPDIPNDAYHGGPGISKSGLDLIARSPRHYRFATDAANDNARTPTAAQRVGSLAHKLILEPDSFHAEYVVGPKFDRRTNAGKEAAAAFEVEAAGRTVITEDEFEQANAMLHAVGAHPFAAALFRKGRAEVSAYWNDPATGVLCRCRPDYWRRDGILVDLKTTDDSSPEEFGRSVLKWRYHVQAAFYLEGARLAMEQSPVDLDLEIGLPAEFVFVAVEKNPPHAVAVYRLDRDSIEVGRREMRADLDRYATCLANDDWPAFGDTLLPLSLPEWHLRKVLA